MPQGAAGDDAVLGRLAMVAGLDIDAGLRVANKRFSLYLRLFVEQKHAAALVDAVDKADYPGARLLAHTIKGASATIGAEVVRMAANSLEADLRQQAAMPVAGRHGDLLAAARSLAADCALLQAAIGVALAATDEPQPEKLPVDRQKLQEIINRLATLLAADEIAAGDVFREHEALLRQCLGQAAARIGCLIDEFSFPEALHELRAAGAFDSCAPKWCGGAKAVRR